MNKENVKLIPVIVGSILLILLTVFLVYSRLGREEDTCFPEYTIPPSTFELTPEILFAIGVIYSVIIIEIIMEKLEERREERDEHS